MERILLEDVLLGGGEAWDMTRYENGSVEQVELPHKSHVEERCLSNGGA